MDEHFWWYLSRATGLVAYFLAGLSLFLGASLTTRILGPKPKAPWLTDLHRFASLATLVFALIHVFSLMLDSFAPFSLPDILIPLHASWHPYATAWGVLGFWVLAAITISSLWMKKIPRKYWYALHLTSYLFFVLVAIHALQSGPDTENLASWFYTFFVAAATIFVAFYRFFSGGRATRAALLRASKKT